MEEPTDKKLTPKQHRFVLAYLQTGNATQAARQAGYKGNENTLRSLGGQNLLKLAIRAAIEKAGKQIDKPEIADLEEVLETLTVQLRSTDPEKGAVIVRAAQLLGKRYGAWKEPLQVDPAEDVEIIALAKEKLRLEVELLKTREAVQRSEREQAERRMDEDRPTKQEGMFYPAGGSGVGLCGCYHAGLDPTQYPNSPLLALSQAATHCPLCGRRSPRLPPIQKQEG